MTDTPEEIKEKLGESEEAQILEDKEAFMEIMEKINPKLYHDKDGKKPKSLASFSLGYDAPTSQIEPVYFWILDFMNERMKLKDVEKLVDNFTSSPGSGHFAEIGARTTKMQEEGMKIMGLINQVIKTILNLVYDLKEFEIRLGHYKDANSSDPKKKEAGMLSVKQIWMDNVDVKKGRGSINQMSLELGFTTLRDVFMVANSIEDVKKNQIINEQVKRILIPRMSEFLKWKELSELELKKRFEIEKAYLRTEVESLKLYTSWAKPYLIAAQKLKQRGFARNPALVNAFNTTLFELVLFGKRKFDQHALETSVNEKKLPESFRNYKLKRNYYSCFLVTLVFRGIPQKVTQQHYGFGGKVDIDFDAFALNEDELDKLKKEISKQSVEDSARLFEVSTQISLEQLKDDLEHFLGGKEEKKEEKPEIQNPFSALFSLVKPKKEDTKKKNAETIRPDNYIESAIREIVKDKAIGSTATFYDVYKKANRMATITGGDGFNTKPFHRKEGTSFWEAIKSLFFQ